MSRYQPLRRASARYRHAPHVMDEQTLWRLAVADLDNAITKLEQSRVREGFYDLVRAEAYVSELRMRGQQLSILLEWEGESPATHPE